MQPTNIEWCKNPDGSKGMVWNPVVGCKHGCEYCYAKRMNDSGRYKWIEQWDKPEIKPLTDGIDGINQFRVPKTVFIGSISDVFGDWIDDLLIACILDCVELFPQHRFIFLTKNPTRYKGLNFPDNCWLGATTDTCNHASTFTDNLAYIENKTFVSAEPLLEDISESLDYEAVDWIIAGALNNNGKPVLSDQGGTRRQWVLNLIEKARVHRVPVFIKNSMYDLYSDLPRLRELPYLKLNKGVIV